MKKPKELSFEQYAVLKTLCTFGELETNTKLGAKRKFWVLGKPINFELPDYVSVSEFEPGYDDSIDYDDDLCYYTIKTSVVIKEEPVKWSGLTSKGERIAGYWSNNDGKDGMPIPKARDKPWKGKRDFLSALIDVEGEARCSHSKGSSVCRICESKNGSSEYRIDELWAWPSGLYHYVDEHNVKPDADFIDFILSYND